MTALNVSGVFAPARAHSPFADRLAHGARRFWYSIRRCWWGPYFRLEVSGLENVPAAGAMLLCGNHASHLDAPAILAALPREVALRASTAAAKDVFADYRWREIVSRVVTNALP